VPKAAPSRRQVIAGTVGGFGALVGGSVIAHQVGRSGVLSAAEGRSNAGYGRFGVRSIIWSVPVATTAMALTFDDGPDPEFTPEVLRVLDRYGLKATFAMMGWNCERHADLAKQLVADGHEVANHGWSHIDLSKVDALTARSEVLRGLAAIEGVTGEHPRWYRPARGELTGAALQCASEAGLDLLMWTVNGGLPGVEPVERIRDSVLRQVGPGCIIDFHDGIGRGTFDRGSRMAKTLAERRRREIESLPAIIEGILEQGLMPMTVSDLVLEPTSSDPAGAADASDGAEPGVPLGSAVDADGSLLPEAPAPASPSVEAAQGD